MSKRIKTYLKFQRSERDKVAFVSYVRKENGSWKGCHESDGCKKKIVLADAGVAETLLENVLYNTKLVPMKECMGFVAISAEPVKFAATIETIIDDTRYAVEVKFGHKLITYEPDSKLENRRSIDGIIQTLARRIDIKDPEQVIADFRESAEIVLAYWKADHPSV
jgi:hypothetical protein